MGGRNLAAQFFSQGWDEGLVDRCVGDQLVLNIPSEMGYGARGAGGVIPPNADLVFDVVSGLCLCATLAIR